MGSSQFAKLFEPGNLGSLQLKNRIVLPPMGPGLTGIWGEVTDAQIAWYSVRARGGAGLICVQATYTATAIDALRNPQTQMRADDDVYAPGLSRLAESIHDGGAAAGIQISAGLGAQARGGPWMPGRQSIENVLAVGPSGVMSMDVRRPVRALEVSEIKRIVELIGQGAARCKRAGFDLIELHAHAGHLIAQFMSPLFNKRTDEYGGPFENRVRFLDEIVASIRGKVGPVFPFGVKYSIDEFIEGGRDIKEGVRIAQSLEKAGVDFISVSAAVQGARMATVPPMYYQEATWLPLAEALKSAVKIPIILPGRLDDPKLAEDVLRQGKADFIAWGRALIADPDLPRKVQEGRLDEVRRCLYCNTCMRTMWLVRPIRCAVNPVAGREREFGTLEPARKVKQVVIVGAGPAGMEAARVAALRGHKVTLIEKTGELGGGQIGLAAVPPHKETFKRLPDYYARSFKKLSNVKTVLGKAATVRSVLALKPDVVIVATGAEPCVLKVPGAERPNVFTAGDVLSRKPKLGRRVVIVGGGSVGCETANLLSKNGKQVTIIEMLDSLGSDIETFTWTFLQRELAADGVEMKPGHKLKSINGKGVVATNKNGNDIAIPADAVVLAAGVKSVDELSRALLGKVPEVYSIGDARQPRRVRDAVSDGYVVGRSI